MSQASVNISQQFLNGQVVPANLVGQDAASKTYVDQQLELRDQEITNNETTMTDHINNTNVHINTEERNKLNSVQEGAEPNQNAFSHVNNIDATGKTDTLTITQGTGIAITTNPTTKTLTITATGEATPGPHGSSHNIDGSDPIPDLVTLRGDFDTLDGDFTAHLAEVASETTFGHVKVDGATITIDENGVISSVGSGNVQATTASITYYVNSATGSDTNDGLTAGTPFATIQHAIDILPQIINHNVTINVSPGSYNGRVTISGFSGRSPISITSTTTGGATIVGDTVGLNVASCTNRVVVNNFVIQGSNNVVFVSNCLEFNLNGCTISGGSIGVYVQRSNAHLASNSISNITVNAIYAYQSADVVLTSNTGTGNQTVLNAAGGTIRKFSGAVPSGTTAQSITNGGEILG